MGVLALGTSLALAVLLGRHDDARAAIGPATDGLAAAGANGLDADSDEATAVRAVVGGVRAPEPHQTASAPQGPPVGPLRLVLVEGESKRPLTYFTVIVTGPEGESERLESDALGRVESAAVQAPGRFVVRALDAADCPDEGEGGTEVEHAGAADPTIVALDCGPTYVLELDAPGPVVAADLRAELRPRGASAAGEREACARFRVHADRQGVWTRVALQAVTRRRDAVAWALVVDDPLRGWSGAADVGSARPGAIEFVALRLEAGHAWRGFVLDASGAAIEGARASLSPIDDRQRARPPRARTSPDGSFEVAGVVPGVYRVSVDAEGYLPHFARLELGSEEPAAAEIVLERVERGDLRGVVLDFATPPGRTVRASLYPRGFAGDTRSVELEVAEDGSGGTQGVFAFEDVPVADYRLAIEGLSPGAIEPESLLVRPPRSDIEFRSRDLGPAADFGLLVRDSSSGARVDAHACWFETERGEWLSSSWDAEDGALTLQAWPERLEFTWIVVARGYRPARGASSEFTERTRRGRFARVTLMPGWGTRIRAQGPVGPIADAIILLDGQEAARTGIDGVAWIASTVPPESIEVRREGFASARVAVAAEAFGNRPPGFGYEFELRHE